MPKVDAELTHELKYVCSLSVGLWSRMAATMGLDVAELVNDCIMSALTQAAYIIQRTRPAREFPFALNRGDKLANLEALGALESKPTEETTAKIWELMKRGVTAEDLVPGLDLLDEVDWTGTSVEQGPCQGQQAYAEAPQLHR